MERTGVGNDLKIIIPVNIEGVDNSILDTYTFRIVVSRGKKTFSNLMSDDVCEVLDYIVDKEAGTVNALWPARKQRPGVYDLSVYVTSSAGAKAEVHMKDFLELYKRCFLSNHCGLDAVQAVIKLDVINISFSGLSAYELAVSRGFVGTLDEWLESLKASTKELEVKLMALTNKVTIIEKASITCQGTGEYVEI